MFPPFVSDNAPSIRNSLFDLSIVPETQHAERRKNDMTYQHITGGAAACPWSVSGRSLPATTGGGRPLAAFARLKETAKYSPPHALCKCSSPHSDAAAGQVPIRPNRSASEANRLFQLWAVGCGKRRRLRPPASGRLQSDVLRTIYLLNN